MKTYKSGCFIIYESLSNYTLPKNNFYMTNKHYQSLSLFDFNTTSFP